MRTLYIDCAMGAAGDMLTAALLELLDEPQAFLEELNSIGLHGVSVEQEKSVKCGITGTHIRVRVGDVEEDEHLHDHSHHEHHHTHEHGHGHTHAHPHEHSHDYDHHHHHAHSGMHEIEHRVSHLCVPECVKADVLAVYGLIAEAESHAHGVPLQEIHFHEVGTMDALADITAVCLLMHKLKIDRVVVSPVHVGSGQVRCAHGILPVPAPATAYILREIPIYGGEIRGELCTPTGAALLKHFADSFGAMPAMRVEKIGYGMGKKDFPAANCVRCMLGEGENSGDRIVELACNLDDMTGEELGFAMDILLENGALDVYTTAIGAKKNRPAVVLTVLSRLDDKEKMVELLFRHTTTLGIREQEMRRYTLAREFSTVETACGAVQKKCVSGYGVSREKYEFEDLARIAREQKISLREAREVAARAEK
ncbi:MAG: nickel pincer cofactor biosynthesis protein LarC [Oscillospiraceae bacterium]|nr:nickel pincer cofactor biosynthesis protein LarC [Oscillospiraceae bacterium]